MFLATWLTPGHSDWKLILSTPPLVLFLSVLVKHFGGSDTNLEGPPLSAESPQGDCRGGSVFTLVPKVLTAAWRWVKWVPTLPVSVNSHGSEGMEKLVSERLSGEGGPLLLSMGKLCY